MAQVPNDPRQHEFSFEIAKVINASGSGFGIVAVVAIAVVMLAMIGMAMAQGISLPSLAQ